MSSKGVQTVISTKRQNKEEMGCKEGRRALMGLVSGHLIKIRGLERMRAHGIMVGRHAQDSKGKGYK